MILTNFFAIEVRRVAVLEVLQYPDPRLRLKAAPVSGFGQQVQQHIQDMLDTLYAADSAVGLAATQVNIQKQIIVIDLSEQKNQPIVLINPEIVAKSEETDIALEGCLSVGGEIRVEVERAASISAVVYDATGNRMEIDADGFLAKCIQHEIDHLNGIVMVDYLSKFKRQRIMQKLVKLKKIEAAQ